ncbi:MAG: 6-phosphofructokinase [Myxococcota bacterium]
MNVRKIGILTGGGDCPGLNAVIRSVVLRAESMNIEVLGVRGGWRGFLENDTERLTRERVHGILDLGGTILGTTRVNPYQETGGPDAVRAAFKAWRLDGLIAVGGEGTLNLARMFAELGLPVVGVPKTIDNDLGGTEVTFGFDTAVTIATEAIDRLRTTAEAHERVMVVEVMGRHAGWIALHAGLAGGADVILVPEKPALLDEVCEKIHFRRAQGRQSSLVVCAEGMKLRESPEGEARLLLANDEPDAFGRPRLGGAGVYLAKRIEEITGIETRVTVLGHVQRGGHPTARDRLLASRFGVRAVEILSEGKFGHMVALQANEIVDIPLKDATARLKTVDESWLSLAERLTQ